MIRITLPLRIGRAAGRSGRVSTLGDEAHTLGTVEICRGGCSSRSAGVVAQIENSGVQCAQGRALTLNPAMSVSPTGLSTLPGTEVETDPRWLRHGR